MRYYYLDGSYRDDCDDVDFGWKFDDIVIDEAIPRYKELNEKMREASRVRKSQSRTKSSRRSNGNEVTAVSPRSAPGSDYVSDIEDSIDVLAEMAPEEPKLIQIIEPNVKEETPISTQSSQLDVEGFIENPESNFYKKIKNKRIPSKEEMITLINPINPESRALLSVISYSKYRSLTEKETNDDVLKTINFKATKSQRIINESDFRDLDGSVVEGPFPDFNFLLNGEEPDAEKQLVSEIRQYHATKEDNMLSLMMELIITDMDSNAGDLSELNNSVNEMNSMVLMETSDLGNSIHSSLMSKEGTAAKEYRNDCCHYLDIPNRSDLLSSIGLSDDIDRSIETFTKETTDMHVQMNDIKKSFEEDDKKVDALLAQAASLQNDLRETAYLDNLIHLLNGKLDRVKNKKLPFRIFHRPVDGSETICNLIV